jgi:hypothetical protein
MTLNTPKKFVQAVTFLPCMREAPGSKLECHTKYPKGFPSFPLVLKANAAVVCFIPCIYSLLVLSSIIRRHTVVVTGGVVQGIIYTNITQGIVRKNYVTVKEKIISQLKTLLRLKREDSKVQYKEHRLLGCDVAQSGRRVVQQVPAKRC